MTQSCKNIYPVNHCQRQEIRFVGMLSFIHMHSFTRIKNPQLLKAGLKILHSVLYLALETDFKKQV